MATGAISQIRDGLKARLDTVTGLRAFDTVPDSVPVGALGAAVVGPPRIAYDMSLGGGMHRYEFPIRVYAGRANERTGQDLLDAYLDPRGATSLKAAIEADVTLGGSADTCRVMTADNYGVYALSAEQYLGAELVVEVYA